MNGLLVDTNVLLVYIVGRSDYNLIEKHKRTNAYSKKDWDDLRPFINEFDPLVTTPSVLAEVSNLLDGGFTGERREYLFETFAGLVSEVLDEKYTQSKDVVTDSAFSRLGLTDIGIAKIAQGHPSPIHVLTADSHLYELLARRNVYVHNFRHRQGERMGV